jgi:uncharacterized repeat protein (TIGR03803 family)
MIFKITPAGTFVTLYSFCSQANCADGIIPEGLMQANDGNFYGTAGAAGANAGGTVFQITPDGVFTTLYSFCTQTNCTDGESPQVAPTQGSDGNLYGTTVAGGTFNSGTIFKINPQGVFSKVYDFCSKTHCWDGSGPGGLLQAADGNLYGTTQEFSSHSDGTFYKLTPKGNVRVLYVFCSGVKDCSGGTAPVEVIQASDGNFYGVSEYGGATSEGSILELTPAGTRFALTTLYSFCTPGPNCPDDDIYPLHVMQATNGIFYGTASNSIFGFSTGLAPFVKTVPTAGGVGSVVTILGNGLTGTTSVSFNCTATTFAVVSDTQITAIVPTGATTGTVQVVTPAATLKSNPAYQVLN